MTESTPGSVPGLPPSPSDPTEGPGTSMSDRMQSLLSQAVADQLSEQRQVATALAEVRALLSRLPQDLQAAGRAGDPRVERLAEDLSSFSGDVQTSIRLLGERLDAINRAVQERGSELADVRGRLGDVSDEVREQFPVLEALQGTLATLPAFPESIGALRQEVGGLQDQLGSVADLHESVADMLARAAPLDTLGEDIRELRAALDDREQQIAAVPDRDELEQAFARMAALIEQLPERMPNVAEDLERLESRLTEVAEGAAARAEEDGGLAERLEAIEQRLSALAEADSSAGLREQVQELTVRMGGVDERLGAITQALTSVAALGERLPILLEGVRQVEEDMGELASVRDDVAVVHSLIGGDTGLLHDIGALRTALDALTDRVEAFGGRAEERTQIVDAVAELVRTASAETERRLTAHVDESVFVLAEALLRRKAPRSPASGFVTALAQPPVVPMAEPAEASAPSDEAAVDTDESVAPAETPDLDDVGWEEEDVEEAPSSVGGGAAEVLADLSRDDESFDGAAETAEDEDEDSPVPWTIRSGDQPDAPPSPEPAGSARKRRPWWRPGG